jgi:hypothetical protein
MRCEGPYTYRDAARRLIVDEFERLEEEHGRLAADAVIDRANHGDLRPIYLKTLKGLSRGGPDPQLKVAALKRWQREFREFADSAALESLFEIAAEARRARDARREVERKRAEEMAAARAAMDPAARVFRIGREEMRRASGVTASPRRITPAPAPAEAARRSMSVA